MYTEKGERTRQHFIEVSARLFNKQGYAGTAVSEILDVAGYSKGALYRTFADKDELSLEAFKYNLDKLKKSILQKVDAQETSISKLLAIPHFYSKNRVGLILPGGCPILNTAIEMDDTNPKMNEVVKHAFSDFKELIVQLIEEGKRKHEFRRNLNGEELAFYIIATIEGSIALVKTFKKKDILINNMNNLEKHIREMI